MARPQIANLGRRIAEIPQHSVEIPPESASPTEHYRRGSNDSWNLLLYVDRNVRRAHVQPAAAERHLARLRGMVLLSLVEAFERYLKELAAICVDQIGPLVLDDRLSAFRIHPRSVAAQFESSSLGRALCEGDTWLDCAEINNRFRRLLAEPFREGKFAFFPTKTGDPDAWRFQTMETLWQLRHTLAHNLGMITRSDAAKFRLLVKSPVDAPKILSPTGADVWYVKNFLDETCEWANVRVGTELATILTGLHATDPTLLIPQQRARDLTELFRVALTIAGVVGALT